MVAKEIASLQHPLVKRAFRLRIDRSAREEEMRVLIIGKKLITDLAAVQPAEILFFDGDMAEIIMYSNALTTFNREQVEGYLAWKWGLQNTLYLGHPFRYAAPTSAASIPFVPTMVDGAQVWYDGADPLGTGIPPSSGSAVTTWFDKGPFARNASGVVAGNYSNDSPKGFVNFNGTSTYYTIPTGGFIANQYFSVFVVERLQTTTTLSL